MQEKSLSERQKEILAEIIKFKKENGFSPTVSELCKLVGLKSTSSMAAQLSNLRDSGHIMLFGKLNDAPFVTLNDAVPV